MFIILCIFLIVSFFELLHLFKTKEKKRSGYLYGNYCCNDFSGGVSYAQSRISGVCKEHYKLVRFRAIGGNYERTKE